MKIVEVFDPAMCCSTGVCGPEVDSSLITFAADLDWLKAQGAQVHRIDLAQQPQRFAQNEAVRQLLESEGESALPTLSWRAAETTFGAISPLRLGGLALSRRLSSSYSSDGYCLPSRGRTSSFAASHRVLRRCLAIHVAFLPGRWSLSLNQLSPKSPA